jgi:hypothetical protein
LCGPIDLNPNTAPVFAIGLVPDEPVSPEPVNIIILEIDAEKV